MPFDFYTSIYYTKSRVRGCMAVPLYLVLEYCTSTSTHLGILGYNLDSCVEVDTLR